jgi:photosystem II stability/assembly factor-like uncharacterized protein
MSIRATSLSLRHDESSRRVPGTALFLRRWGTAARLLPLLAAACSPFSAPSDSASATKPDHPGEAARWHRLRLVDENGRIPAGAFAAALAQRAANVEHWSLQPAAGGIGRYSWVERGPFNVGGRTRSLVVHPTTPARLWAGSVGGGIWYSSNSGFTWTPVDDRMSNLAIGCLAIDPRNPDVLYAGTGEGYFNGDAIRGNGIYKSTDGGVTWARIPSTASFDNVCRIAISPADSNLILVGRRYSGIWRSTDGGATWTNPRWAQGSYQVLFDPNNPSRAVAHVIDHDGQWFHRVLYSTDAGATWREAASGLTRVNDFNSRIELAYAPSAPNVVYASCGAGGGQVWHSADGGVNWTVRGGGLGTGWYYNGLWVDPTDANFLLVGAYRVYKSTNGGATFGVIGDGYILTVQPHPDVHAFVPDAGFNGTSNRRVYVLTDGGVHVADDIRAANTSSGWRTLQFRYRASQFYGAAGVGGTNGLVYGGTQDNGSLYLGTGLNNATLPYGGDGGFCAVDPTDPRYLYGEYINLLLHRSTDGGLSAQDIHAGITDAGNSANFIAPFILDPNNPNRLLAGGRRLWRSNNVKAAVPSWSQVKSDHGDNVSAIAVAPGASDVVWVGHNDGKVFVSTNGTAATPTWIVADDNGTRNPLPNRYVARILVDPTQSNTAYVALGGFSGDNLWRTTDRGNTWSNITGTGVTGLPDVPIYGIARHPQRAGFLYVGTEVGVFASEDGGATWSTSNDGPADARCDELVFMHGATTLLAATHGRGLWTIDVRVPAWNKFGAGCAGTAGVPDLDVDATKQPRIGEVLGLRLANAPAARAASFSFGTSDTSWNGVPLPVPLDFLRMTGCTLYCSLEVSVVVPTGAGGVVPWSIGLPADRTLLGQRAFFEAFVVDPNANPSGVTASNAVAVTIGN